MSLQAFSDDILYILFHWDTGKMDDLVTLLLSGLFVCCSVCLLYCLFGLFVCCSVCLLYCLFGLLSH